MKATQLPDGSFDGGFNAGTKNSYRTAMALLGFALNYRCRFMNDERLHEMGRKQLQMVMFILAVGAVLLQCSVYGADNPDERLKADFPDLLALKSQGFNRCRIEGMDGKGLHVHLQGDKEAGSVPIEDVRVLLFDQKYWWKGKASFSNSQWESSGPLNLIDDSVALETDIYHPSMSGDTIEFDLSKKGMRWSRGVSVTVSLFCPPPKSQEHKDALSFRVKLTNRRRKKGRRWNLSLYGLPTRSDGLAVPKLNEERGRPGSSPWTMPEERVKLFSRRERGSKSTVRVRIQIRNGVTSVYLDDRLRWAGACRLEHLVANHGGISFSGRARVSNLKVTSSDPLQGYSSLLMRDSAKQSFLVPRFLRYQYPTHMLISRKGDLLRGRLTTIEEGLVHFSLRDETVKVPVKAVAALVRVEKEGEEDTSESSTGTKGTLFDDWKWIPMKEPFAPRETHDESVAKKGKDILTEETADQEIHVAHTKADEDILMRETGYQKTPEEVNDQNTSRESIKLTEKDLAGRKFSHSTLSVTLESDGSAVYVNSKRGHASRRKWRVVGEQGQLVIVNSRGRTIFASTKVEMNDGKYKISGSNPVLRNSVVFQEVDP